MTVEKKNLANNKSKDYSKLYASHLSIQLSLDGFSFCIIDKQEFRVIETQSFQFADNSPTPQKHLKNVSQLFENHEVLQQQFDSVNITHVNSLSTLVPRPLFDPKQLKNYIKYNSKVYKNDYIVYDPIHNHDIYNVYIPFVNINNFFLEQFGAFEYKHFSTVFIENLLNIYKYSEHPHMFVNVSNKHFEIVSIANSKLLFYNSFEYHSKEDFIYYILFTAEQLKFNPDKFDLVFSGLIDMDDDLYKIAYKYVRNIGLIEIRSKYSFPSEINERMKRRNFTLLNQY